MDYGWIVDIFIQRLHLARSHLCALEFIPRAIFVPDPTVSCGHKTPVASSRSSKATEGVYTRDIPKQRNPPGLTFPSQQQHQQILDPL